YSDRPGTVASTVGGRAPGPVIRERARRVREIAARLSERFRTSQIGTTHRALTLEDGSLVVTGNYLKVRVPPGRGRNEWVRVTLVSHDHGELLTGGPLLPLDNQLTAGGADVAAAALPNRHGQPVLG